jgi:hypothetical protein
MVAPLRWGNWTVTTWARNWCFPFRQTAQTYSTTIPESFNHNCSWAPTMTLLSEGPEGYVGWGGNLTASTVLLPNYTIISALSLSNPYSCTQHPSRVLGVHVDWNNTATQRQLAGCDIFPSRLLRGNVPVQYQAVDTTVLSNTTARNITLTQVPPLGMRFVEWKCTNTLNESTIATQSTSALPAAVSQPVTSSSPSFSFILTGKGTGWGTSLDQYQLHYTCVATYAYGCPTGLEWDVNSCRGEPVSVERATPLTTACCSYALNNPLLYTYLQSQYFPHLFVTTMLKACEH